MIVEIGTRVATSHGPGTLVEHETARASYPNEVPERRYGTGRVGVQLDTWPFAWVGTVAYYRRDEIEVQ